MDFQHGGQIDSQMWSPLDSQIDHHIECGDYLIPKVVTTLITTLNRVHKGRPPICKMRNFYTFLRCGHTPSCTVHCTSAQGVGQVFKMHHDVVGLPFVADDGAGSCGARPRGQKRACLAESRSAGGSEAVASAGGSETKAPRSFLDALPVDRGYKRGVAFVHRGSHEGGEGSVPPALQEVLVNMGSNLSTKINLQEALDFLGKRRKGKPVTLAAFLSSVLPLASAPHLTKSNCVIGYLTGLSPSTVQNTLHAMRQRGNMVARPRGAGGRPREDVGRQVGNRGGEEDDMEDDEVEGEEEGDVLEEVVSLGEAPTSLPVSSGELIAHKPDVRQVDVRQIGLTVGALVACLCYDVDHYVFSCASFVLPV